MDNVDCWQANCIPGEKAGSQGMYSAQLEYNKWLANTVHKYGMAFGLKVRDDNIGIWIQLPVFVRSWWWWGGGGGGQGGGGGGGG